MNKKNVKKRKSEKSPSGSALQNKLVRPQSSREGKNNIMKTLALVKKKAL